MSIVQAYEVIERVIVSEMIEILRYDGESTAEEWARKRKEKFAELNAYVLSVLGYNNRRVVQGVQDAIAEAERLIDEHIEEQWGIAGYEHHTEEYEDLAINFLNDNIQRALASVFPRVGTVEQLYNQVIDTVLEDDTDDDLETLISTIMLLELGKGLSSGFIQSNGVQWRLDRYVNEVEKHMYQNIYDRYLKDALAFQGVELVKVFKYVRPRDACVELQESGTICIVPRKEASEESLKYPNIWDTQHKYLQPDGHHGIHCRHVWHHIEAPKNMATKLYESLDRALINLEFKRMEFKRMVERLLKG